MCGPYPNLGWPCGPYPALNQASFISEIIYECMHAAPHERNLRVGYNLYGWI